MSDRTRDHRSAYMPRLESHYGIWHIQTHTRKRAPVSTWVYDSLLSGFLSKVQPTGQSGDRWKCRILFTNSFSAESRALPRGCFSWAVFSTHSKFRPQVINGVLMQETFKVAQADDLVPRSFEIPCRFVVFLNAGFRSCYCRRRRRHRRCCGVGVDNVVVLTVKPLNHIVPWTSLWPRSCWGRDKRPWPPTWTKCGSSSRRHRCLGPDSPIRCGYVAKKTWGWWHPTGIIFI